MFQNNYVINNLQLQIYFIVILYTEKIITSITKKYSKLLIQKYLSMYFVYTFIVAYFA